MVFCDLRFIYVRFQKSENGIAQEFYVEWLQHCRKCDRKMNLVALACDLKERHEKSVSQMWLKPAFGIRFSVSPEMHINTSCCQGWIQCSWKSFTEVTFQLSLSFRANFPNLPNKLPSIDSHPSSFRARFPT